MTNETISPQKMLEELLAEVDRADSTLFPPPADEDKSDKLLVVVENPFLRKLYATANFYKREAAMINVGLQFQKDDADQKQFDRLDDKADFLMENFWYLVREQYDLHSVIHMGIRSGWRIMEMPCNHGPQNIIDLLGRGPRNR